jgi:hypothetical protein
VLIFCQLLVSVNSAVRAVNSVVSAVNSVVSAVNGVALDNERYRLFVYFTNLSPSLMTGLIWLRIGKHDRLL